RRDPVEDRRTPDQGFAPGGDVVRGDLTGEVILKQVVVVRRLEQVFKGWGGRGLALVFLNVGTWWHNWFGRRRASTGRHDLANHRRAVLQPIARIATGSIQAIEPGNHARFAG